MSTLNGKNLLWSKFFSFREDHFEKGRKNNFDRVVYAESVSINLKIEKEMLYIHSTAKTGLNIFGTIEICS